MKAIREWLKSDARPANLYDLLGVRRFDPDCAKLLETVRQACRELRSYQNHRDPHVVDRAAQLQRELQRAEATLVDSGRLLSHHLEMIDCLRRLLETATDDAGQYWDRVQVETWLVERQRVHPKAANM